MKRLEKLLFVVTIAWVSCQAADKQIPPFIQATADQTAYRSRIEDCIRAVKTKESPDSAQLSAVREHYRRAMQAVNAYYVAVLDAVQNPNTRMAAADAAVRANADVTSLVNILATDNASARSLIAVVPPLLRLAFALFDLAPRHRSTTVKLDAVADSLGWAPWEAIR